jgi:hypothetical protein
MSPRARLILDWFRSMSREDQFSAGYTMGFYRACEWQLDDWERCYLKNILSAREQGISA